ALIFSINLFRPAPSQLVHSEVSHFSVNQLTPKQQKDLYITGKVWGFVKYFHPSSMKGEVEMDEQLFKLLPKVVALSDTTPVDDTLHEWIRSLGSVNQEKPQRPLNARVAWIATTKDLSTATKQTLREIYNAKRPSSHYYTAPPNTQNDGYKIHYTNEKSYTESTFTDHGLHLLSLFRFWNGIQYLAPNLEIISDNWTRDWDDTLERYIPKFLAVRDEVEFFTTQNEMMSVLRDPHARIGNWFSSDKYFNYIGNRYLPVYVKVIDGDVVVKRINSKYEPFTDFKVGDILTKIEDTPMKSRLQQLTQWFGEITPGKYHLNVYDGLVRVSTIRPTIEVIRNGKPITITSKTSGYYDHYYDIGIKPFKLLTDRIGYIRVDRLTPNDTPSIFDQLRKTDGFILDLRYYPGYFLHPDFFHFLGGGDDLFAIMSIPDIANLGTFQDMEEYTYKDATYANEQIKDKTFNYKGKIVVLIDEQTQSQPEFTTMALRQFPNVVVMGVNSIGGDGNVSTIPLPRGVTIAYTGFGVYTEHRKQTQIVGLTPDIVVEQTKEGLAAGHDEMIDAGIRYIQKGQ
ncbi:MAG: S41 family peptidase, partial [Bacilli bacterium]